MNENSPEEVAALLGDVNELVDNDHCHVNTSDIVSVTPVPSRPWRLLRRLLHRGLM